MNWLVIEQEQCYSRHNGYSKARLRANRIWNPARMVSRLNRHSTRHTIKYVTYIGILLCKLLQKANGMNALGPSVYHCCQWSYACRAWWNLHIFCCPCWLNRFNIAKQLKLERRLYTCTCLLVQSIQLRLGVVAWGRAIYNFVARAHEGARVHMKHLTILQCAVKCPLVASTTQSLWVRNSVQMVLPFANCAGMLRWGLISKLGRQAPCQQSYWGWCWYLEKPRGSLC